MRGAGTGCIRAIDVQGKRGSEGEENFTIDDLNNVSNEILTISQDLEEHKYNARELKQQLISKLGCTWRHTARTFLGSVAEIHIADSARIATIPVDAGTRSKHSDFAIGHSLGAVPSLAELRLEKPVVHGLGTSWPLMANLVFGGVELEAGDVTYKIGVSRAELVVRCKNCQIATGSRLEEKANGLPADIMPTSGGWVIKAQTPGEPLCGSVFDGTPLGLVELVGAKAASIDFELSCQPRDLVIHAVRPSRVNVSANQTRMVAGTLEQTSWFE